MFLSWPKSFSWNDILGKALTLPPRETSTTKPTSKRISNSLRSGDIKLNSWALIMIPVVHRLQIWNLKSFYDDVQAKQPSGAATAPLQSGECPQFVIVIVHFVSEATWHRHLLESSSLFFVLLYFTLILIKIRIIWMGRPFAPLQHSFVIFILCSKQPGTVIFSFFFLCFILRFW